MDRPDGASETEHPSSTPQVTVKIGSTTVKGVSTKKPKISVAPTSSSEQVEEAKESFGQVRKSILFLFAVVILYALYIVFSGQFDEFVVALADVDTGWLIAGALCYFVYYFLGILAYVISVITDPESPVGVRDLMSVEASGIFFMNLTPNGAGAAPAQIYRLTRAGISVGQAGALQFTRFVMY